MKLLLVGLVGCLGFLMGSTAHADILVLANGKYVDGKIVTVASNEVVIRLDGSADADPPSHVDRAAVSRIIYCDETGAAKAAPSASPAETKPTEAPKPRFEIPQEPAAPPIAPAADAGDTYYLIPLHGEVGATVLASALEKSLADALLRKPGVIILDIDSPGGLVEESLKIMKVIGHYNKQAKIVAFIEQDLSAAVIFTLSVKTIYVKQLGTIGAATSFIPGRPDLSAKVEEKMQSAWRAAARNSAEEGGHDPLLADAMIDNDVELYVQTMDGKPVIKEGTGEHMLVRKGKILTLTSHEAVACGLAAGRADDLGELCTALGCKNWTECKGLATALAEYLPRQHQAFESAMNTLGSEFSANLTAAIKADPTGEQQFVEVIQRQVIQQPGIRGPMPGRPYGPYGPVPGRPFQRGIPQNQVITRRVVVTTNPQEWKAKALECVVALQATEASIDDSMQTCSRFGHDSETSPLKDLKTKLAAIREKTFRDRNKYGSQLPPPPVAPSPAPAIAQRPSAPHTISQIAPLASDPAGKAPTPDGSDARLKEIEEGWKGDKTGASSLLAAVNGISALRNADQSLHIPSGGMVCSPDFYGPPVTFRVVLLSSGKQVRINFGGSSIFFNSTMHPGELRFYIGPAHEKHKPGAGTLPKDQWVAMEFTLKPDEMIIYVDAEERYRLKADFSKIHQQFVVRADTGDVWVKSIDVIQTKDAGQQ